MITEKENESLNRNCRLLIWGLHSKTSMWSDLVILSFPIIHDHPEFGESVEYFTPQAFSPELVMETFHIPVLGWTAWIDLQRFDILFLEPLPQ
jgi:hypothetical protein